MLVVTGGAGFIGSCLVRRLAATDRAVWVVDHPPDADRAARLATLPAHRFSDHETFLREFSGTTASIDGVFHFGACSSTTETNWPFLERNNIAWSQSIWRSCAERGTPLVYASSAATYGDGSLGFDDSTPPSQLRPLNLYGRSKNDFDAWALGEVEAGRAAPPRWAGVKFFNVYGPGEDHKGPMASMVWQALRQIRAAREVALFRSVDPAIRDGEQRRDFVYVEDCLDHALWLLEHPHGGGLYNSGTGIARTFLDLVRAVFAALDLPPRIRFIDTPASLAGQYQNYTCATMDRLRATGFNRPPTSIEDGVRRYVDAIGAARPTIG